MGNFQALDSKGGVDASPFSFKKEVLFHWQFHLVFLDLIKIVGL